jgi:RNA polymerase sigma factor (TIGR02999 family)
MEQAPEIDPLAALAAGQPVATDALVPLVYDELRRLARAQLAGERAAPTLQPTALVHEAFVRLVGDTRWNSRGHFFSAAALAMRRVLVERARARDRQKRGGGRQREDADLDALAESVPPFGEVDVDLLALEEVLERLARVDERKSRVVHLRYFLGLTIEETAEALELSATTVKDEWLLARAWLKRELDGASP